MTIAVRPVVEAPVPRATIRRFTGWARLTHAVLALSVFGLILTGMPLKYVDAFWASPLMRLWGGARLAGRFHRGFAAALLLAALMHVGGAVGAALRGRPPRLTGPDSILPGVEDARQLAGHVRFLRGRGAYPEFGRFTYWEKFDYFAVAWGLAIIGLSGVVMWFPVQVARYLPGRVVEVALILHSDEALLATGFLFAIHFFNTHLRPDAFPVDRVMFSGTLPEHEARERYPGWYARLAPAAGAPAPSTRAGGLLRAVGTVFLALGVVTLVLVMSAAIAEVVRYIGSFL